MCKHTDYLTKYERPNLIQLQSWPTLQMDNNPSGYPWKKISILCLQETHLDTTHVQQLKSLFGHWIQIIHSQLPDNPTSSAGVTIVINKELLLPSNTQTTILVPGRAIISSITWYNNQKIMIANIYTPNSPHTHAHFWIEIQNRIHNHPSQPDFLLGDFNIVEDPLDRAPTHKDYPNAVESLQTLHTEFGLQDIWRSNNPSEHMYTLLQFYP